MKKLFFLLLCMAVAGATFAQNVGIDDATPPYKLSVNGTFGSSSNAFISGTLNLNSGTNSYSFPTARGTNGQVLQTDGAGNTAWAAAGSMHNGLWFLTGNAGTTAGTNFIGTTDNTDFVVKTNNTEKMRVQAGGNVGIGTNNPAFKFVVVGGPIVQGNMADGDKLLFLGNATSAKITHEGGWTIGNYAGSIGGAPNTGGVFTWNGVNTANTAWEERMRLNRTGLGIGTNNPTNPLTVVGNNIAPIVLQNTANNGYTDMYFKDDAGVVQLGMGYANTGAGVVPGTAYISTANIPFGIRVNNVERMRFTTAGNVGIGTATPSQKLHIGGMADPIVAIHSNVSANGQGGRIHFRELGGDGSNGEGMNIRHDTGTAGAGEGLHIERVNGGTASNVMSFDQASGKVGIGTAAPTQALDIKSGGLLVGSSNAVSNQGAHLLWNRTSGEGETWLLNNKGGSGQPSSIRFGNVTDGNVVAEWARFSNGSLGIGTTTPTRAKLEVVGNIAGTYNAKLFDKPGTNLAATNYNTFPSIYASDAVLANDFLAHSDARIKNVIGLSNKNQDLETLNKIQITDYKMKDVVNKGNKDYKKVIAQQVESVYPQAVGKSTEFVPSVYELSQSTNYEVSTKNLTVKTSKNHDFKAGDKVRLMGDEGQKEVSVSQVIDANTFVVGGWEKATDKVFVYGKQVNDFRSVDYEAISMLNVSATQRLYELIQAQQAQIDALKAENGTLKTENKDLKASVESRLQLIEQMLKLDAEAKK